MQSYRVSTYPCIQSFSSCLKNSRSLCNELREFLELKNEKFVSKAPEAVVAGAQAQLAENQAKLKESEDILNALSL